MPKRTVFNLSGGRQAVKDEKGGWWMRYRTRSVLSNWAPYASIGEPKGLPLAGKLIRVVLPIDRSK